MARQWSLVGKPYPEYDEFGDIKATTITLAANNDGYATFTETVPGDHTRKTNDELIELAKDQYFKKEYSNYAVEDAVVKVDELERSIKKSHVLQTTLQELIKDVNEQSVKNANDLREAENRRNSVLTKIIETINGYEERFTTFSSTMNGFMDEILSMLDTKEEQNDTEIEGSTQE